MPEYSEQDDLIDIREQQQDSKKEKIKSKIRFARFLLLFVAAVFAIVLLFINKDKLNADNFRRLAAKIDIGFSSDKSEDNSVIDYDYNPSDVVGVYKDGIARVTSDSLVIMDNAGTQFQSVLTGFNNPALVTTDKYVMTFDRGGRHLIVANSFAVVFDITFDDNIVTASMNDSGYFAVVTESDAYKNKLIVYNSSFEEIYKLWNAEFEDNIAVSVICKDDSTVCALFEWGVCILDSKGKEKCRYEFGNKFLQAYSLTRGKYNCVVLSDSHSGSSAVTVFDNAGKKISETETDVTVISADIFGDRLALLSRDKIYIYTVSGKLISERENPNDAMYVLFSDKNSVLVVSDSGIVYNLID